MSSATLMQKRHFLKADDSALNPPRSQADLAAWDLGGFKAEATVMVPLKV